MKSIENNIENTLVIKKSKFICKLFNVTNLDEINKILDKLKDQYKDSTHICYAYILNSLEKTSDDGEPSGTAGMPILNILKKKELNMILCVVIRYFGGIKLGAGGLVRAYSNSAIDAINKANIIELEEGYLIELEFNIKDIKLVDYILIDKEIVNKNFDTNVTYSFYLTKEELNFIPELEKIAIHISIKDKCMIKKSN